jgi:hypothetical protein
VLPLIGGTLTGALTLPGAPTLALNAATKGYVDGVIPTVPAASSTTPIMDGTAATGVATPYSREDHVHPSDTSRAPQASPTFTGIVTIPSGAAIAGYAPLASPTFTGTVTLNRSAFGAQSVTATGATTIAWTSGEAVKVSVTANATIAVTGWPASPNLAKLVLDISNTGAFNITGWPTGTKWAGGVVPTITSGAGKRDLIMLITDDGGTTILGSVVGQNYS